MCKGFSHRVQRYDLAPFTTPDVTRCSLFLLYFRTVSTTPNWQHHSRKEQKRKLKPQALRARKAALKALKLKLSAP